MTLQILPLRTDLPRYSVRTELDGALWEFHFEWNDRAGSWFFSLRTVDGVEVASGVRVCLSANLLQFVHAGPPGAIVAEDTLGTSREPGLNELGGRVELLYIPAADLT